MTPPAQQPEPAPARISYKSSLVHRESGLRFDAPQGWGFVEKPQYSLAECRVRDLEGDLPVILVQASPASADLSMEVIVSGYSREITRRIASPKIIVDQAVVTQFRSAQAYQVAYSGSLAGSQVMGSAVLIHTGDWLVVATLLCPPSDFDRLESLLRRFARLNPDAPQQ